MRCWPPHTAPFWVIVEVEFEATVQNKEDQDEQPYDWILPSMGNVHIMLNKETPNGNDDVQ